MRRCLLLFFVLLLPLQMVWASATPYCEHESGRCSAQHFGHHEHRHEGSTVTANNGDEPAGAHHADCASCHICCVVTLPPPSVALLAVTVAGSPLPAPRATYLSYVPAGPERPDRAHRPSAVRFGGAVALVPTIA